MVGKRCRWVSQWGGNLNAAAISRENRRGKVKRETMRIVSRWSMRIEKKRKICIAIVERRPRKALILQLHTDHFDHLTCDGLIG